MIKKIKKIGLALGGGGARGCAHLGVIKALREADIPIDFIAGTSIGAFMGGIYVGGDMDELEKYLLKIKWKDVVKHLDPVIPRRGLIGGKKIVELIEFSIHHNDFKQSKIPFTAVATDLSTGEEVHIKKGKISDAIRASVAIPGIMTPFKKGRQYLIDGGVVNPLPVNVVKEMGADIVIAVDLNHYFIKEKLTKRHKTPKNKLTEFLGSGWPNIVDVLESALFMMEDKLSETNLKIYKTDILIRPKLSSTSIFDFHHAKKLINEGYKTAKKEIPKIKKLLNR